MNDIIKQRLVGALILVALGVVFWPIIFVEPGERDGAGQGRIPLAPVIDTSPVEVPEPEQLRASPEWQPDERYEQPPQESALVEPEIARQLTAPPAAAPQNDTHTRSVAPEPPVLDSKGVPVAWILQVASVSSAAKADELRDRLIAMQEKAYVKKIDQGGKSLYRVYIGPNFERARLEGIQANIDSSFGVRSLIVRYLP